MDEDKILNFLKKIESFDEFFKNYTKFDDKDLIYNLKKINSYYSELKNLNFDNKNLVNLILSNSNVNNKKNIKLIIKIFEIQKLIKLHDDLFNQNYLEEYHIKKDIFDYMKNSFSKFLNKNQKIILDLFL